MVVWIAKVSAGNPLDRLEQRMDRSSVVASYLADRGHNVTLFCSAYNHYNKKKIFEETTIKKYSQYEKIIFVYSNITYKKNISISRLIYNHMLAKELKKIIFESDLVNKPDVIFVSFPTPDWCLLLEEYGQKYRVPVIVDTRDEWPDAFLRIFPRWIRSVANLVLEPWKRNNRKIFKNATAICAMSDSILNWALHHAKRKRGPHDCLIYIDAEKPVAETAELQNYIAEWNKLGVSENTWNICVFSGLNSTLDFDTVFEAIKFVHEKNPQIRFIQGGVGVRRREIDKKIVNCDFMIFPGWLNNEQMISLMSLCKVGLIPYIDEVDLKNAFGNKVGQYLSMNLPIVESPSGVLKAYVEKNKCGVYYNAGDAMGLANIIIQLINNPNQLRKMSANAKVAFEKDFEHGRVMQNVENMMIEVVNQYS